MTLMTSFKAFLGDKQKITLVTAGVLLLIMVTLISNESAKALGARMESGIAQESAAMEKILDDYTGRVNEMIKESAADPAELKTRLENSFGKQPDHAVEQDVVSWLEGIGTHMSEFLHEKLVQMLTEGKREYQTHYIQLNQYLVTYGDALDSIYVGLWLWLNGYPGIELSDYRKAD
jgi:hypothetical protein